MKPDTREGYKLFRASAALLARMEANGVGIDLIYLDGEIDRIGKIIRSMKRGLYESPLWKKWHRRFGEKANLNSVPQLATMLKGEGIELVRDEETGNLKADKHVLAKLDMTEIPDLILLREYNKVVNTYLKGIRREVGDDGRLHPSYNLTSSDDKKGGAASYRISSSNPNSQNIPVRNPIMRNIIRPAFKFAGRGIDRDFSGIETKVAACYTKDPQLIQDVSNPASDVHSDMAMALFFLPRDVIDRNRKTVRDCSKNRFVFPNFYGSVYFQTAPAIWEFVQTARLDDGRSLLKHLRKNGIKALGDCAPDARPRPGTYVHHVQKIERKLWEERWVKYSEWKRDWYGKYLRRGWFPLKTGFVCRGYYRRNQVLNFAIQGSAAHCMLKCMIELQRRLDKYRMKALLVMTIHDSLLSDVPDEETQDYLDISDEVMGDWLMQEWSWLIVPITTEVEVTVPGGNWNEKVKWNWNKKGRWSAV